MLKAWQSPEPKMKKSSAIIILAQGQSWWPWLDLKSSGSKNWARPISCHPGSEAEKASAAAMLAVSFIFKLLKSTKDGCCILPWRLMPFLVTFLVLSGTRWSSSSINKYLTEKSQDQWKNSKVWNYYLMAKDDFLGPHLVPHFSIKDNFSIVLHTARQPEFSR